MNKIDKYGLAGKAEFHDDDPYETRLFPEHDVEVALDRAEKDGIALVRDEIDRVIAAMKGVGESDDTTFPDVVGNLVGASHIERLRKELFG
jgi:hypothetical protein